MIQNKLFDHDKETLEIRIYCYEQDWKDKLASRLMELSLQGWFYEASSFSYKDYEGIILEMRFIRFRNGPIDTNIDADLIEQFISI